MEDLSNKVILTVATTGGYPTKEDSPYVPITPNEIAEEVIACAHAGASIAHIHVRNDAGKATMESKYFEETADLIRADKSHNIILNLTTANGTGYTDEERFVAIKKVLPEMASYDCGSMNWQNSTVFENSPKFLEKLGLLMQEINIKPEIEIFDVGMLSSALYYLKKCVLKAPLHFQFVLGVPGGMPATVQNLVYLHSLLPSDATWSALGIGKGHLPILYATLALGGNVRVGMEDNLLYSKGILAKSNVDFVERTKRVIKEFGKEVATPDEARQILGLK